eukprot:TRINITY_DN17271_c0_g1_i1.p1 TRINITY_DN17271_c0_g1~~TRINITY_DN17271_c0_g1_i1.p1  ORF type:complete len:134 (+),score=29.86 TRINITY_DN17271_c0_g1_i1:82-483(+)
MGDVCASICVEICLRACCEVVCTVCITGMCQAAFDDKTKVTTKTPYSSIGMDNPAHCSTSSGPKVYKGDEKPTATMLPLTVHTVKSGDTAQGIILKYNTSRDQLYMANGVKNDEGLMALSTIIIPSDSSVTAW